MADEFKTKILQNTFNHTILRVERLDHESHALREGIVRQHIKITEQAGCRKTT